MVRPEDGRPCNAVVQDSVRRVLCADSQFSSARVQADPVVPAARQEDIVPDMAAGRENNVAARIRRALRVQDFRLVQEWVV